MEQKGLGSLDNGHNIKVAESNYCKYAAKKYCTDH